MINQCIEDFEIPVINENGMMTESILKITSGMFFKESKDNVLSGAEIKLENIFDDTFIEISKETQKSSFENIKFVDLLDLQRQLDEEVAKPRENGFVPRRRNYNKMVKSMIAEIIEFNEETENTHKTCKQKEFDREKMIKKSVDICFFYLQICNLLTGKDQEFIRILSESWERAWESVDPYTTYGYDVELELIKHLSSTEWCLSISKCLNIMTLLISIYVNNDISKDKMIQTYLTEWKRNITVRIKDDWSL